MKTKSSIILVFSLIFALFVLAACGGADAPVAEEPAVAEPTQETVAEEATPEEEIVEEAVQEEPTPEEEVVEEEAGTEDEATASSPTADDALTLTIWTQDTYAPSLEAMVDAALEEYGVTLVVETLVFEDMFEQFNLSAPAGEGPDILVAPHNIIGELSTSGLAKPLDLSSLADQLAEPALLAWQYDGEQYGLPFNTENVGFFINTDIVPECPATWTEVMEISREIAGGNDDNVATNQYGFVRMEGDPYHFYPLMTAFGGYVFGRTDEGYNADDVGLDSEGALAAARFWDQYISEGLQPAGVDGDTMMSLFESGQSAMTITGPWYTQRIIDSGINFEICPIPGEVAEIGEPFMGSFGYVVSNFSDNPDLAEIFTKEFLGNEDNMRLMFEAANNVPAHLGVLATIDDPYLAAYAAAGRNAQAMPAIPEMTSVWSAFNNAVTLVSQQGDEPENAFRTAAEQIRTAIEENQ
jgi:arabinogalactan oligomer / maltooligosaccharide transport system substrate-binding protein